MYRQLWADLPKSHVHLASFLLRVGLAIVFIFHGYLKLVQGGGAQWSTVLPEPTQIAVAWGETVCGFALLFGLLSRLAAIGLTVIMVGAIVVQTGRYDFIYTRAGVVGDQGRLPTGSEYNFALIVMCLAVVALGSGRVSLDHLLFRRWLARREAAAPTPAAAPSAPAGPAVAPV